MTIQLDDYEVLIDLENVNDPIKEALEEGTKIMYLAEIQNNPN